jgi:subtilase family serine protease
MERSAGQVLAVVSGGLALVVQPVDPSHSIRLTFALRQRDMAELRATGDAIADPHSPQFGRFLTFDEAKARFAPTDADVDDVVDWARSAGLHEVHRFRSNQSVIVESDVGTVNSALGLTINEYERDGHHFFANDRTATLPPNVAAIVGDIFGLESARQFHHAGSKKGFVDWPTPKPASGPLHPTVQHVGNRSAARKGLAGGGARPMLVDGSAYLEPPDIWSSQAYNFGNLANVSGCCNPVGFAAGASGVGRFTSIAFVEQNNAYASDIDAFLTHYNISASGSLINIDNPVIDQGVTNGDSEATADFEWAAAMAAPPAVAEGPVLYTYAGGNSTLFGMQDQPFQGVT